MDGPQSAATELFRRGVAALGVKDYEGAANLFRRALEIERRRDHHRDGPSIIAET